MGNCRLLDDHQASMSYSIMMLVKFLTSANQIAQIGSCDRSRIHVPDLGGTGVWPGKNGFHKKYKNLDNIAVYLIASLKSKWKNKLIKNMNNWIW